MESFSGESGLYSFWRGLVRLWFSLIYRRIRVLQEDRLPRSGPCLLVVNHPSGFIEALILAAALRRQVHCLLDQSLAGGHFERLAARGLGMMPYNFRGEDWPSVIESVCRTLSRGGMVLIFARQRAAGDVAEGFAPEAAELALEAEAYLSREAPLPVHPAHLFIPAPPSGAAELLIHIDQPLASQGASWRNEEDLDKAIKMLDGEIARACCQSPFRLQPSQVEQFIGGLEIVMREDFAESWSHRPNWKQRVEDFDLSPFLIKLTHQLNYGNPGRLAALNESLRQYEERKRRAALQSLRASTAGPWRRSGLQKSGVWAETIVGFPVACYGLLNLLLAWFVLWAAGLWKSRLWEAAPKEWMLRAAVALGCYAVQIGLAAHFLPRAWAGAYVPSLLLSGAYLLRYLWLWDRRTSVLVGAAAPGRRAVSLRRLRKALIAQLKQDQDRHTAIWKIAR